LRLDVAKQRRHPSTAYAACPIFKLLAFDAPLDAKGGVKPAGCGLSDFPAEAGPLALEAGLSSPHAIASPGTGDD
jgi:hypothetical protein